MILKYGGVPTHAGRKQMYYDDVACVLRKMCLDAKAPHLLSTLPPTLPWKYYMLLDESTLPPTFIDSATHFTLEVL
ncbi:hypothetical protein YC2023_094118 [Brassica napus]